jgi:hypothetical protein
MMVALGHLPRESKCRNSERPMDFELKIAIPKIGKYAFCFVCNFAFCLQISLLLSGGLD